MPKVSICSSVLNQSVWFKEMVEGCIAQTFKDWELIVVDDGSTEDLKAIIDKFTEPRIRYVRWDENRGIPHGINHAFSLATGEYVQPLAADELLEPSKLEMQVQLLDGNPALGAVFGLPKNGDLGLRPIWEQYQIKAHNRTREQWLRTLLDVDQVPLGGCNALWRRKLFDEIGYFDENLKAFTDHEWYCRLVQHTDINVLPYRWALSRSHLDPNAVSYGGGGIEGQERGLKEIRYVREKHILPPITFNGLVTVGIPVLNMAVWVLEAIDSVLANTHKNVEIWVVDDGSTDGTMEAVVKHIEEKSLTNVHVHRFDENKGDRVAYAYMLEQAKGDFFVPLSSDDKIEPTFLERALGEFQADACCEMVGCQTDFIGEDGTPFHEYHPWKSIERAANKAQQAWIDRFYYGNVYFGVTMFKTAALREVGGWKQEYGCLSDYAMYLELIFRSNFRIIEEDLSHTRIHKNNISKGIDQVWLMNTYFSIKQKFYPPRVKLIIATPFYESRGFSPYIVSLAQTVKHLTTYGIEHDFWELSGDAYVDRAKNTIVNKFLENPENTHLLMIDSDMQWNADAVMKILALPQEIVLASYPMKNAWERWTSIPFVGTNEDGTTFTRGINLPDGSALIECAQLSGGFVMYKRGPLERYKAKYSDRTYKDHSADPTNPEREYTEFFCCELADGLRWGEDRVFSKRLTAMDEKMWIYPNINISHYGVNGWHGNFDTYLRKAKSDADQQTALALVPPIEPEKATLQAANEGA